MDRPVQLVILGSGDRAYEQQLQDACSKWPYQLGLDLGYDESLAHLIEAGADIFLMPSRFEPCGLNQMYSQRYGTLPVVTPVGGLYDTVVDASEETREKGIATGFVMDEISTESLVSTIDRAIKAYRVPDSWRSMIFTAMSRDFSWSKSAEEYSQLYQLAIQDNPSSA
jgi:starch synthase